MALDDDDLDIHINLILDGNIEENTASFTRLISHIEGNSRRKLESVFGKMGSAAGGAFDEHIKKETSQTFKNIRGTARKGMKELSDEQKFWARSALRDAEDQNKGLNATLRHGLARRLQNQRTADSQSLIAQREGSAKRRINLQHEQARETRVLTAAEQSRLQIERAGQRSQYVQEQASQARRTALFRAGLRSINSTYENAQRGFLAVVRSNLRRRENEERGAQDRLTAKTAAGMAVQSRIISNGLADQNSAYSRGARRRLETIERNAAAETKTIRAASVKQAQAIEQSQTRLNTGVVGAAAGNSGLGRQLRNIVALHSGVLGVRAILETLADFQQVKTAFRGIFDEVQGGAPKTTAFLAELQRFAAKTPFTFQQLADVSQKFFANKLVDPSSPRAVQDLESKLIRLSDAAAATGRSAEQMNGAVLGLTQISASGRLSLEDLRQVTEGVGLRFEDLAAELGTDTAGLFDAIRKGSISAEDGLDAIFRAMSKIPGATGASARQARNLRGAMSTLNDTLQIIVIKAFGPLAETLALGITRFAEFLTKLASGKGIYKIVRDGLIGMAAGMTAIIAAKGAIEVVGLLHNAVSLLAASNLFLVVAGVGALAGVLFSLVKNVKPVNDFFTSLIDGTKNWAKVGFLIKKPIEGLSSIVQLQTGLGAAAGVIVDSLGRIKDAFGLLFGKNKLGTFGDVAGFGRALQDIFSDLGKNLTPIISSITSALSTIFTTAREWIRTTGLPLLAKGTLNIGSFIAALFGRGTSGGDFQAATALGARVRDILAKGLDSARRAAGALDLGGFIGNLIGGGGGKGGGKDASTTARIGARIREIVVGAFRIAGGAVAGVFTDVILPGLVELPRTIGRFLSRTVFSEQFLRIFRNVAAGVAAVAAVVVVQFIRGFVEGMYQRRGEIAEVLRETLVFAVKSVFGSRDPFKLAAAGAELLLAAFAGVKVISALGKLRRIVHQTALAIKGDLASARRVDTGDQFAGLKGVPRLAAQARSSFDTVRSGFGRANSALSAFGATSTRVFRSIRSEVGKAGAQITGLGTKLSEHGRSFQGLENRSAPNRNLKGQFAVDRTPNISRLSRSYGAFIDGVGQRLVGLGATVQRVTTFISEKFLGTGTAGAGAFSKIQDAWRSGLTRVSGFVEGFRKTSIRGLEGDEFRAAVERNAAVSERRLQAFGTAAAGVAGAVTGYFLGAATDTQSAVQGIVGAMTSVVGAFATLGAPGGAVALVGVAVGLVFGNIQKKSQETKKRLAEIEAGTESLQNAFKTTGIDTAQQRVSGVLTDIQGRIDANDKGTREFFGRFQADLTTTTSLLATNKAAFDRYVRSIVKSRISDTFRGDAREVREFNKELTKATDQAQAFLEGTIASGAAQGTIRTIDVPEVEALFEQVTNGTLAVDDLSAALQDAGVSAGIADQTVGMLRDSFETLVRGSKGVVFGVQVSKETAAAIQQQIELQGVMDALRPSTEKVRDAFADLRARVNDAAESYRNFLDARSGKQLTENELLLRTIETTNQIKEIQGDKTLTAKEKQLRIDTLLLQGQRDFQEVAGQAAEESGGNYDVFKGKLEATRQKMVEVLIATGHGKDEAILMAAAIVQVPNSDEFTFYYKDLVTAGLERTLSFAETSIRKFQRSDGATITYRVGVKGGSNRDANALNTGGRVPGPNINKDVVHAILTPGEVVIRKAAVQKWGLSNLLALNAGHRPSSWKMPGFNEGGAVTKVPQSAFPWQMGPFPLNPNEGSVLSSAGREFNALIHKITLDQIAASAASLGITGLDLGSAGNFGAGAGAAAGWVRQAMSLTGVPARWFDGLMTIARRESGFNPKAINLWDRNAKEGHASRGIMQTIPSTFNAHKLPGLDDIFNPVHNIVAAIRYILAQYGDISRVQQANPNLPPKGYAAGGLVTPTAADLNRAVASAFEGGSGGGATTLSSPSGGPALHIENWNVNSRAQNPETVSHLAVRELEAVAQSMGVR